MPRKRPLTPEERDALNARRRQRKATETAEQRQKRLDYNKRYMERNAAAIAARLKRRRAENREAHRARERAYYAADRAGAVARKRRWQRANPAKVAANKKRNYARKAGVPHEPWTTVGILERDCWECQIAQCLSPTGRGIDPGARQHTRWAGTADHIKPIIRGGPDTPANLQAAHRTCNSAKGDRWEDCGDESAA